MAAMMQPKIKCLFVDIGGVMLTDGWNHVSRALAAQTFGLDFKEMEIRHHQTFDTYEMDKLDIKEYLNRIIFYKKRPFTLDQFRNFMFEQSKPCLEMLKLIPQLKARYGLKIVVVSNEARELNAYRIKKFKLDSFVDSFISSCYVKLRKPDEDIFKLALDTAQVPVRQIVYIENTSMFVQIAERMGIQSILHTDYASTCTKLAAFGFKNEDKVINGIK